MKLGAHYRCKATGNVYVVERVGTSLSDPCVLRCIEQSAPARQEMRATWERDCRHNGCTDTYDSYVAQRQMLEVEPAWFEHAAVEVKV